MFYGFTKFHNDDWVSFHANRPNLTKIGGHPIGWKRVCVKGTPIEWVEFSLLRKLVREFDEFADEKASLYVPGFEDWKPYGHDCFDHWQTIRMIRLFMQYRMVAISEPLKEGDTEDALDTMRERILDHITRQMCH